MALFSRTVALTPGAELILRSGRAGVCIEVDALKRADIIISTTRAVISLAIRIGTDSVASHASLYAGGGDVIEAIGSGVTRRRLEASIAHAAVAVAYRHPDVTPISAASIIAYAAKQVGAEYDAAGAVRSANSYLCQIVGPQPAAFFCSELVAASYRQAGVPLTTLPPQCVTPQDVVRVAFERLVYVGHLKGDPVWFPQLAP